MYENMLGSLYVLSHLIIKIMPQCIIDKTKVKQLIQGHKATK